MEGLSRESILPYLQEIKALSEVELHESAIKNASLIVSLAEDGHAKSHAYFAYGLALRANGQHGRALRAFQAALREAAKVNSSSVDAFEWGIGDVAETEHVFSGGNYVSGIEFKSENEMLVQGEDDIDIKKKRRKFPAICQSTSYGRFLAVIKFRTALCHIATGNDGTAINVLESIPRDVCPGAAIALLGKLKRKVRAKGALATLKAALSQVPFATELSLALLEMEVAVDDVISLMSASREVPRWLELLLMAHGDFFAHRPREAAKRFAHLNATILPNNAHVMVNLARSEAQSGQKDAAVTWFSRARMLEPMNFEGVGEYAEVLKQNSDKVRLAQLTHEVLNDVEDMDIHEEAWVAAAHLGDLQGEPEKSLLYLRKALERSPQHIPALHLRGTLLLGKKPMESLACFASALCIRRDLPGLRGLAEAYLAMQPPRINDALQVAKEAVNLVPYDSRSYIILAKALSSHQMTEALAAEALQRALNIEPNNVQATLLLADVRSSQYKRGECSPEQIMNTASLLTLVLQERGQPRDQIHCKLGDLYMLIGDDVRALEHFHHALSLNPNSQDARDGLNGLEERRQAIPTSAQPSSNRLAHLRQQISPTSQRRSPALHRSSASPTSSPDVSPHIRRRRT